MSQTDVCTTREAAERLGVSLRTVQLWVESGILPAWKTAGGHRRISVEAVESLARERGRALSSPTATPPGRAFRVMIVEDEESLRQLYELRLSAADIPLEVYSAANGYEALLTIGEKHPDFLISDLSMPAMDGFRMIRTVRNAPEFSDMEIVVVTALGADEIEDRGGLPEGIRVLPKPIPFVELEALIRERYKKVR